MSTGKTVKYGIVGCGGHACSSHVNGMIGVKQSDENTVSGGFIENLELIAIADPNQHQREAFVDFQNRCVRPLPDVKGYSDLESMLQLEKDLDAIIICTPDRFHLEQLVKCIEAGKHVLVEKPVCVKAKEFKQLVRIFELAEEKGLVISSCHPRRYDAPYVKMKSNLETYKLQFGNLIDVQLDFIYPTPSEKLDELHPGGLLADHINHEYDYMNFLLGYSVVTAHRYYNSQTRYKVSGIRESDDVTFTFNGTRLTSQKDNYKKVFAEKITLRFENGLISYNCANGLVTEENYAAVQSYFNLAKVTNTAQCEPTSYTDRFTGIMANFRDAILGDAKCYLTLHEIYKNTAISISLANSPYYKG